MFKLDTINQ